MRVISVWVSVAVFGGNSLDLAILKVYSPKRELFTAWELRNNTLNIYMKWTT